MSPDRRHGYDPDYTGPERRRPMSNEWHAQNLRRFKEIDDRMKAMELELRENTRTTREVRELMELARSGFKVLGWFGSFVKWVGGLSAAAVAIWGLVYTFTHGGQLPPK